jgi:two-component system, chemotaxis family, chemotaxis protein CheY
LAEWRYDFEYYGNNGTRTMSKVVIVDDSTSTRMILGRILRELGYEVCEAVNGKDALKVIESEKAAVSLVLADWSMPEMNGLDLVKRLRQNPELASLKVVMVTTETEVDHIVSALEAGANEYIMKPFTKDIIREKLELVGILPTANG